MKPKPDPSQETLLELFYYDDGILVNRITRGRRAKAGARNEYKCRRGYVLVQIKGKLYYAHRLIWVMHNGEIPEGMQIDHIDGCKGNNLIENLRLATNSQNVSNQGKNSRNTSGFKGVTWNRRKGKWLAQIRVDGRLKELGLYGSPNEAHKAYRAAATKYFGEFARFE